MTPSLDSSAPRETPRLGEEMQWEVSRLFPYALFALLAIEIVLLAGRHSVWYDESFSVLLIDRHDVAEIARRTAVDSHPPLWYWVAKPWLVVFGPDHVALRLQQGLFMFAAVAIWYRIAIASCSRPTALLALGLLVTNPMILHYAVEGRMYAFGALLVAAAQLLLISRWRWRWLAYWPLAVAMLYTHYFLSLVIAAQFMWLFLDREHRRLRLVWLVPYGASIVIAFLPWIPYALATTRDITERGFWIPPLTSHTPVMYVHHAFLHFIDSTPEGWVVFPALGFTGAFVATLVRAAIKREWYTTLLWCLVAIPLVALFVLSCKPFVPIFHPRYVVFSLPALIVLVAVGLGEFSARMRFTIATVVIAGQLFGLTRMWNEGRHPVRGYHSMDEAAPELRAPVDGQQPAIVATWWYSFFDAKVTLHDRDVRIYRSDRPGFGYGQAVYYDKRDWYVHDLSEVPATFVWFIEDAAAQSGIPAGWQVRKTMTLGYGRFTLLERSPPPTKRAGT